MNELISAHIRVPVQAIRAFCEKWQIVEFALFGSVLRDDFTDQSDIDVLVQFAEGTHNTLFDLVTMGDELEALFGRKVDLVDRQAVENSRNYLRRRIILDSAEVIYAA